ncbi:hypothetical protein [Mucilaginibacter sp. FT3.2]|uniref:hypothetical protein n=1 Tax=Mucilaginibacter sp. FT3.2 TaxID=2723090 RepID=UPI00160A3B31|nr:hypothetical protein [Mucilaginibacter sp. FT3.2]MBB6233094.1 hypothetical protein [Mucilaginibacter sp. FT3.2]
MEKFDIHYAVSDRQIDLNIRAKNDAILKCVYYSLYKQGIWLANIYKTGQQKYKALSYTGGFHQNELDVIGQQIDLLN